jgi:hypothetical protein
MPYIDKDESGKITAIYGSQQKDGQEYIQDDDPLLIAHYIDLQRIVEAESIKAKLVGIDIQSIRSIREFIISKYPDAPDYLKEHENAAAIEREKLK